MGNNYNKIYAILENYKKQIKNIYPEITEESGVYIYSRYDIEDCEIKVYIGQAKHLLTRLAGHMIGHDSHIDKSLKKWKLATDENPNGWYIAFQNVDLENLDKVETVLIENYRNDTNCECYNITDGGQGKGKTTQNGYTQRKGYRDGQEAGRIRLCKELKHIIDLHLDITPKKDNKSDNKALDKFFKILGY